MVTAMVAWPSRSLITLAGTPGGQRGTCMAMPQIMQPDLRKARSWSGLQTRISADLPLGGSAASVTLRTR
jgi:hypothetical protein